MLAYADRSYSRSRGLASTLGRKRRLKSPRRERGEGDNLFTDSVVALDADTGERNSESFVHGLNGLPCIAHQEKVIDFAYRSFHETTVKAKAVIAAFYGNGPKFSYMDGCGTGAQYAQAELQRYPEDYNGIAITGFSNKSNHVFWQMWAWYAAHQDEASNIPPDKYKVLHNAVLQQCDLLDGIKEGVLEDPRQCKVDLTALHAKPETDPIA